MDNGNRGYEIQKRENGCFLKGTVREEDLGGLVESLKKEGVLLDIDGLRELSGKTLEEWTPVPVEETPRPVEARITQDGMTAEVFFPEEDGRTASERFDLAKAALVEAGVQAGLDEEILKEAAAEKGGRWIPVAFGKPPKDGVDAYFEVLVDMDRQGPAGSEHEEGKVDHRSLGIIHNVTKGQEIVRKVPMEEGEDGFDVTGKVLRARRAKDVKILAGPYTTLSEDGLALIASEDGHLVREGNRFTVYPVFEVKGDVDYATGNLEFVGSIVIQGSVKEDFSVRAEKSLEVHGVVERASLSCGGDMRLTSSVRGMDHGKLESGGSIFAEYVDQCIIRAARDVVFKRALMHCDVEAGMAVRHTEGGKGLIAGGSIKAGSEVECLILGSGMETKTVVYVGVSPALLRKKKKLLASLEELEDKKTTIGKNIRYLTRIMNTKGLDDRQKAMALKFVELEKTVTEQIAKLRDVLGEVEKTVDAMKCQGCVKVWGVCHPGVSVTIRGETLLVREPVERIRFVYRDGRVTMVSLD